MLGPSFRPKDESRAAQDTFPGGVSFRLARSSLVEKAEKAEDPVSTEPATDPIDELDAARRRFDDACARLRPDLHRFCTRMLGNPCDAEDVLQDALVLAFYRSSELRD